MDSRTLLIIIATLSLTAAILLGWRTSAASRECSRQGGTYSLLEKRCLNQGRPAPKVIIQRDLLRT